MGSTCCNGHELELIVEGIGYCHACNCEGLYPFWAETECGVWVMAGREARLLIMGLWPGWAAVKTDIPMTEIAKQEARELAAMANRWSPWYNHAAGMFAEWGEDQAA